MDQPCTKCGAGVPAGAQFCAACGTPVTATGSSATPQFTPVQAPPQSAGYTAVPPTGATSSSQAGSSGASGYAQAPPAGAGAGYSQVPPTGGGSGYSQVPPSGGGYAQMPPAGAGGQYGSMPMAPPPSGGNTAVKVILIIVAIFVGIGILGAGLFGFAVWRVARSVHHGRHGELALSMPNGTITANPSTSFTAEELGTDIYPGAETTTGGMKMSLPSGSMVTGVFLSSDNKDAVRDFYKSKLGSGASVYDSDTGCMISLNKNPKDHLMVTVSAKPSENEGKTKIVIVHTTRSQ